MRIISAAGQWNVRLLALQRVAAGGDRSLAQLFGGAIIVCRRSIEGPRQDDAADDPRGALPDSDTRNR